jgi:hypothetical protein
MVGDSPFSVLTDRDSLKDRLCGRSSCCQTLENSLSEILTAPNSERSAFVSDYKEKHDCESTFSRRAVNRQVGAPVGNIEVSVRVESKRQVLPVSGTLILVSPVKFILLLPLGGFVELSVRHQRKRFSLETGNLSIIDPAHKRVPCHVLSSSRSQNFRLRVPTP